MNIHPSKRLCLIWNTINTFPSFLICNLFNIWSLKIYDTWGFLKWVIRTIVNSKDNISALIRAEIGKGGTWEMAECESVGNIRNISPRTWFRDWGKLIFFKRIRETNNSWFSPNFWSLRRRKVISSNEWIHSFMRSFKLDTQNRGRVSRTLLWFILKVIQHLA